MDLNLDTSWRIGESAFRLISQLIRDRGYRSLVEFGSGASTARWILEFPEMSITSIEHDAEFLNHTRQKLHPLAWGATLDLQYRALTWKIIGGRPFLTYETPSLPGEIGIVLVDGPPGRTQRGREACLYYCYDALAIGGTLVLDDADRPNERQIVRNWMATYGESFTYDHFDADHGLAVLTKIADLPPRFRFSTLVDSWKVAAQYTKLHLANLFTTRAPRSPTPQ